MVRSLTVFLATASAGVGAGDDLSFDKYGGWKAVRFEPGRFFRTHFDGKRWWLVTPDGHAFLSIGACVVGSMGSFIRGTDRYPYHEGVLAKHGDVATWAESTRGRMRAWGFNTMAAWSGREVTHVPRTDILHFSGSSGAWVKGGMPDYFDPAFAEHANKHAQSCRRNRDDPWLIGYFLDNELAWDKDWRRAPNLFDRYALLSADAPGKQAWASLLKRRHKTCAALGKVWSPAIESWEGLAEIRQLTPREGQAKAALADRHAFELEVARRYFRVCREAIRAHDPNHLVLGCRFVSWVTPKMVVKACGEYCDVVSINYYELGIIGYVIYRCWQRSSDWVEGQPDLSGFYEIARKPLMITEFGFRSKDSGLPNTYPPPAAVQPLVRDQTARGDRYAKYVEQWSSQPFFVGYHWFRWMDEPKEGRFDGENGNYGLVDIRDEPYRVFVQAVTRINRQAWLRHRENPAVGR